MPFYHALVRPGLLTEAQRKSFAGDVVDVHCGVTGAPPSFVHAMFSEDTKGDLPQGRSATIHGTIRAGRTDAQKAEIADRLNRSFAARAGVGIDAVTTSTTDIEASYTMEGGQLLPEPGSPEEAAWSSPEPSHP